MNVSLPPELEREVEQRLASLDRGEFLSGNDAKRITKERIHARRAARGIRVGPSERR